MFRLPPVAVTVCRRTFPALLVLCLCWTGWVLWTTPAAPVRLESQRQTDALIIARGAYHIHSRASDGTGTLEEIAAAAAAVGLDFIVVTDHGDGTRPVHPPRYLSGVLCVPGVEVSTADGHYAAIGLPETPYPLGGEGRDVIEDVERLGGFGIAAHPDSAKRDLQWREWDAPFPAVEWFNGDSQWRDEARWRFPAVLLRYWRRPTAAVASLFDRPAPLLARWDRLTQQRPVVVIAGHDAHQRLGLKQGEETGAAQYYIKAPTYQAAFSTFSLGVVLPAPLGRRDGTAAEDARSIEQAIRLGRVYTAIDAIATPALVSYVSVGPTGQRHPMGSVVPFVGPVRLSVSSNAPPGCHIRFFRNGQSVGLLPGPSATWNATAPGVYRVEMTLPGAPGQPPIPWVMTNPIYLGVFGSAVAPSPLAPPDTRGDPLQMDWRIEQDADSEASLVSEPSDARPGFAVQFRLGRPKSLSPFVAITTPNTEGFSRASGLVFQVRADRPMRASVQWRRLSHDPDDRWRRSFYADRTPRNVEIRFDTMKPVREGDPSAVPRAQQGSLMFVIDAVNTARGQAGTLEVRTIVPR